MTTAGWIEPDISFLSDDLPPKVLRPPMTPDERMVANFLWRLSWNGNCLEWRGYIAKSGYGIFRSRGVHIFAFEFWFGSVPKGQLVLHECDNPICVSPHHLIAGSQAKNMADKIARGRWRGGRGCFGEMNNGSKFATRQVQMALDLSMSGWWQAAIARRTGIPVGNVGSIIRRRSWTQLTPRTGVYAPPTELPRRWQRFEPGTKLP